MDINWKFDEVHKSYIPTLYPGESIDEWDIPEELKTYYNKLNSVIEAKYSKEYLKLCAFYNKMFPSLKSGEYIRVSYLTRPFTAMDQERSDTGYGVNYNYLKEIIDHLTSRLGTINFAPKLLSEERSYEYIVYKDEVERILREYIKRDEITVTAMESFHDAAILCFAHALYDPFVNIVRKCADFEIGVFESEFDNKTIKRCMYRNFNFPTSSIEPYLVDCDEKQKAEMWEKIGNRTSTELCLFFDCVKKVVYATIQGVTLPSKAYDFDTVLIATMQWDVGAKKQLVSSMFDMLYPIQREINRIAAKIQQLIRMYKGAIPVFNSDVDLAMKSISNGSGEALYVDSSRPIDSLMTVINPTPLDTQLSAEIQERKTLMYELAGIQNASFNMENMRSAAAVIALDQTRDIVFQAQLSAMSNFIQDTIRLYIKYNAVYNKDDNIDWESVESLLKTSHIDMKPVHINDPLSDESGTQPEGAEDFVKLASARVTLDIIKGNITYDTLPYYLPREEVILGVASMFIKFNAYGVDVPDNVHTFLLQAYIDQVKMGNATL